MSWKDWIGRTIGIKTHDVPYWAHYFGGRNSTGKPVNQDSLMTVSAAWACIMLLSRSTGILPCGVYRTAADGGREEVREHPAFDLVHGAWNAEDPAGECWQSAVANLCTEGNAFAHRSSIGAGAAEALFPLHPRDVQVVRNERKQLRFTYEWRGTYFREVGPERCLFLKGPSFGGDVGLSAIRYGSNVFGIAMAGDDIAGQTLRGGPHSSGWIETDRVMNKEQREQFTKSLNAFQEDESTTKLMLLEGGFKYNKMGINPDDLQLLLSRGFSVEQVCSWFGVPPFMIGHTEKTTSWGAGLEQQLIGFLTFALLPWLTLIEKRLNLFLLTPQDRARGLYCSFNVEGLLRADSAARALFYEKMLRNGIFNRDTVRGLENRGKIPGGDVYTVEANLLPLDKVGQAPAPADNVRQAFMQWLGLDRKDDPPGGPAQ